MKNKQDILKLHPMIGRLTPMQWDEIHKAMDAYLNEYKTEQLALTDVSKRELPPWVRPLITIITMSSVTVYVIYKTFYVC